MELQFVPTMDREPKPTMIDEATCKGGCVSGEQGCEDSEDFDINADMPCLLPPSSSVCPVLTTEAEQTIPEPPKEPKLPNSLPLPPPSSPIILTTTTTTAASSSESWTLPWPVVPAAPPWLLDLSSPLWPISPPAPPGSLIPPAPPWSVVDHPSPQDSTPPAPPLSHPSGSDVPPPWPSGSLLLPWLPELSAPSWPSGSSASPWLIGSPFPPWTPLPPVLALSVGPLESSVILPPWVVPLLAPL
ncbi:Filamentous hemagglutinin [Labeo rohita]|uniref:Filamentous hemagglutinin n=1 Tax=Labeo rohita TaxID=84645 RepID=A0ABQ8L8P2_LABRO|nr:Filamentous hemagglutinin [Labeo rohita]